MRWPRRSGHLLQRGNNTLVTPLLSLCKGRMHMFIYINNNSGNRNTAPTRETGSSRSHLVCGHCPSTLETSHFVHICVVFSRCFLFIRMRCGRVMRTICVQQQCVDQDVVEHERSF